MLDNANVGTNIGEKLNAAKDAGKSKKPQQGTRSRVELPTYRRAKILDRKARGDIVKGAEETIEAIREDARNVADALLAEDVEVTLGEINDFFDNIIAVINQWPNPATRDRIIASAMAAMIEELPSVDRAMNAVANFGFTVGFFAEAGEKLADGAKVLAYVSTKGLRGRHHLTTSHPGSTGLLAKFRAKLAECDQKRKANFDARLEELREGVAPMDLSEAIEKGAGEVAFFAPNEDVKNERGEVVQTHFGGNIRIRVCNSVIVPVDVVGRCERVVRQLIDGGVELPIKALTQERVELKQRLGRDTFMAVLIFRSLILRGLKYEAEIRSKREEVKAIEAKATLSPIEFVAEGKPGDSYLYLKGGWVVGQGENEKRYLQVGFLTHRDEDGNVHVVETLNACADLFGEECRTPKLAGEKYEGLNYPLGHILRKLFAIMSRAGNGNGHKTAEEK